MNRFTLTCGTALLLAAGVLLLPCDASAQKKKAPPKSEQAVSQPTPPAQARLGGTLRDVLVKHKGVKTNLGILSKVEGDYFVVEEEGVSTMHPFSAIISLKMVKAEEEEEEEDAAQIEIVLIR